jgi:putative ABC transport system ATP-binding protein
VRSDLSLVEARGLVKSYGRGPGAVAALRGVDLQIAAGEFVAVTGASGSGKSTLLHILGCLDRPDAGTCLLNGRDVSRLSDAELSRIRRRLIGFVFQTFHLLPQRSILENVLLPFLYRDESRAEARRRAARALERVGLEHRARHRPAELSGGEMQRAAIARALVGEPLLVLADEPTGNLDTDSGGRIMDLFRELNREGTTFVMVTHNRALAERCDRELRLRDGRPETGEPAP